MIPLTLALREFSTALLADRRKEKTVNWYKDLLSEAPANPFTWLANEKQVTTLQQVKKKDLREFLVWLDNVVSQRLGKKLAEPTTNGYRRAMHRFFSWCAEEYEIANPMKDIAFPKDPTPAPKAVSIADVDRMLSGCGDDPRGVRNRAILLFLLDTGCRAQGLCNLTLEALEIERGRAIVTEKGSKTRVVIFTRHTAAALARWAAVRSPSAPAFFYSLHHARRGQPLTTNGLAKLLKALGKQARVKGRVNPHSFRHAFAREYIIAGGDLATLAGLMGHARVDTTVNNYAIFTGEEIRRKHEQFSPVNLLAGK